MALFDTTFAPYVLFGSRILSTGAQGTDVAVLQAVYNLMLKTMNPPEGPMGSPITITGTFDIRTRQAVCDIQSYFGLSVDEVVSSQTYFVFGQGVGPNTTYGGPVYGSRELSLGDHGGDVKILQNRLNCFSYASEIIGRPADGVFDRATADAVGRFKGDSENNGDTGFPPNAVAGFGFYDASWLYTFAGGRSIMTGRNGFDVVFVQVLLKDLGFYHGRATGFYDDGTRTSVMDFQRTSQITPDGIVGPETFFQLGVHNDYSAPKPFAITWPPFECETLVIGDCAHAEGSDTMAGSFAAHAEGWMTTAGGGWSHAEGQLTRASGAGAHAEGGRSRALGECSHAEGVSTEAFDAAHAEGEDTKSTGVASHAEGVRSHASNIAAHAEGGGWDPANNPAPTVASGESSHAEGVNTLAQGFGAHAEGGTENVNSQPGSQATGHYSHAEGHSSHASGHYTHAEGQGTFANGNSSHAEGWVTFAEGDYAHAEGFRSLADGFNSHAEGHRSFAEGAYSHAECFRTHAEGDCSHAEGALTTSSGIHSHAEGNSTTASGEDSHAEGSYTSTNSLAGAHIMGQYGAADSAYSWHLANGTSTTLGLAARIDGSLAQGIATNGWVAGPADYAEMFETADGKLIDVGYFVTFDKEGDKIRKANAEDPFILGITSATPAVLGGAAELEWQDKWMKDEWGRWIFREVTVPAITSEEGVGIVPERKEMQKLVNPEYDSTKSYIPRSKRPEWVAVGLLGKLLVRDDGTCRPGGYGRPNAVGIATDSQRGYRVLKRTGSNQVSVLIHPLHVN